MDFLNIFFVDIYLELEPRKSRFPNNVSDGRTDGWTDGHSRIASIAE